MQKENWRAVPGYENAYMCSDMGRVKSLKYNKVMSPGMSTSGYCFVSLYRDGVGKKYSVHRLVSMCFHDKFDPSLDVHHINHIKTDNRLANLEQLTRAENIKQSYKMPGRKKNNEKWKGVAVNTSKLTPKSVREIMALKGHVYQKDIAPMYGVSEVTIKRIHQGRSWKHITT